MSTLLLDQAIWDLVADANGQIAMANNPYAIAQDVACELRTFKGEVYYDDAAGVPYWQHILGKAPPPAYLKAKFESSARKVVEVAKAKAFIRGLGSDRKLRGQVQVVDIYNNNVTVKF